MVFYNKTALLQMLVSLVPGGIAYGIAKALGAEPNHALQATMLVAWFFVDVGWRARALMADRKNPEGIGVLNLISPNSGGHLMLLPGWVVGAAGTIGTLTGWF